MHLHPALRGSGRLTGLLAVFLLVGAIAQAQPNLFRDRGRPSNPGPHGIAANDVEVDADVLSDGPPALWLDIPGRPAALATATGFETRANGGAVWRGSIPAVANSQVVLTRHAGLLAGTIWIDDETYELLPGPGRSHTITRLDSASFPGCDGGVISQYTPGTAQDSAGSSAKGPIAVAAADPNAEMHLLSMYTPQARDAAGGVAQIEATIRAAVDNTNTAFINSDMIGRYVVVHTALSNRNDSGDIGADLNWLRMDAATASLRNLYGADMVSLIVNSGGCGVGYVQNNPGSGFAGWAFQVTVRGCAVGNLTFAHEHGHNLGMEHDYGSSTNPGSASFPWSFGAFIGGGVARTVMAYPGPCGSCFRVMHHSNPDVSYQGNVTGNAADRDNARTGDTTSLIAHDFRADATPPTLLSITVNPSTPSVDVSQQQAFTATGNYDDSSTQDLTATSTWTSSNPAIATVSGGSGTGVSVGTTDITAAFDGITSSIAVLTVNPPPTLDSITVSPVTASVDVGQQQGYTATGNYSDLSTQDLTATATWNSSNSAVATVAAGTATGVSDGTANITASFDGVTSYSAVLTVTPPPTLLSIALSPTSATIPAGSTQVFTATGSYDDLSTQDLTASAAWGSSNTSVATINGSGTASGISVGTTNITASLDGVTSPSASLTVTLFDATGIAPSLIQASVPTTVTISGSGFVAGATLAFQNGSGHTPQATTQSVSPTQIVISISVSTKGPKRDRVWDVVVQNGDGQTDVMAAALTVTLNSIPNNPPSVSISTPGNGSTYAVGVTVGFTGSATDSEDGDISANLAWSSNLDGTIGSGSSFSTALLTEGVHQITATVTDSGGLSGNASISITVGNPNTAPEVSITSPDNGSSFQQGASISFTGSATDAQDGNLSANLSWSSNLDGEIGSGPTVSTSALGIGAHTITASVSDGGLVGSAQISVTITSNSPGVTVTAVNPNSLTKGTTTTVSVFGTNFVSGASVSFQNGSGPSPTATSVSFVGPGELSVSVRVPGNGPKRSVTWDVRVTNPDSTTGVGSGLLTTAP